MIGEQVQGGGQRVHGHRGLPARFEADAEANAQLARTVRLDSVSPADFDAVFYPGGHGPLWDLAEDKQSIALIEAFDRSNKPHGFVCHAPGVLRHALTADGKPLVQHRQVTGFTNAEEEAVGLTDVVPFLIEDEFTRLGGNYSKGPDWAPYVLSDGHLVTGHNDQHTHMTVPENSPLQVGDMLCFGMGHPCTTFDKWQVMMLVDPGYDVVGAIRTYF